MKAEENQRLKLFMDTMKIMQKDLAALFETSNQNVSNIIKKGNGLSEHHLGLLEARYDLNKIWLRTGSGSMLGKITNNTNLETEVQELRDKVLRLEGEKTAYINMIMQLSQGGSAMAINTKQAHHEANFYSGLSHSFSKGKIVQLYPVKNAVQTVLNFESSQLNLPLVMSDKKLSKTA